MKVFSICRLGSTPTRFRQFPLSSQLIASGRRSVGPKRKTRTHTQNRRAGTRRDIPDGEKSRGSACKFCVGGSNVFHHNFTSFILFTPLASASSRPVHPWTESLVRDL